MCHASIGISQTGADHSLPLQTALVCGFLAAKLSTLLVSGGLDRASVGHNQVTASGSTRQSRADEISLATSISDDHDASA